MSLPEIPNSAPFSAAQRLWLNGYLAALFSEASNATSDAAPKERVLVLYASQSGNSETLAEDFGGQLTSAGFEAPVLAMDEFAAEDLTKEKTLLIVSSTWGEGDPPDNAVDFWEALSDDAFEKLESLKYAVLGLGDTNYLEFCGMGKQFDSRLEALGATRFTSRGDCDTDFEETASAWFKTALEALGSSSEATTESAPKADTTSYSKKHPFPAKLLTNRLLNAADSERDTRHFEFSLEGSGMTYEVGDVLGVYAKNDPALVDELIDTLNLDPAESVGDLSLRESLLEQYDIRAVGPSMIKDWPSPVEGEFHEVIDLAKASKASFESGNAFVSLLRKLGPRLYSISSSPKAHPDEVHLTVAKVQYEFDGRPRKGVCSTYLADRVNGDGTVPVFLQTAKHFKLPTDLTLPVIMVGPGTGIAPFRAFLEEREATKAPGKNWLFFGNPHEATDWFYRDEFDRMSESGVLSKLSTAWSRDQETKIYVQDRIREAGAELWQWLNEGAHLYVCGDAKRMAKDVDAALHDVIQEHGKIDAAAYVTGMKKDKRYQRDVY